MKKLKTPLLLCIAAVMFSCIDKEFDLTNIETDDVAIGNNQSEFEMPLATILFTSENICSNTDEGYSSIKMLYDEADIWFPTTLPNNAEYIEIYRMLDNGHYNTDYFHSIVHALKLELQQNKAKLEQISAHIATKYRNSFVNALYSLDSPEIDLYGNQILDADDATAKAIITELILNYADQAEQAVEAVFIRFLGKLHLDDINTQIPAINLSKDVRDMLLKNLDDSSVENPVNCLYISGKAHNEFPFYFQINAQIVDTAINFGDIVVNTGDNTIDEVRVMRNDMQRLLDGATLKLSLITLRYYPHHPFTDDTKVNISLQVRKTGALQL